MAGSNSKFGFPKALHLRKPAEFRKVYERKCSVSDGGLVVYGRANDLDYPRVGFSVSRKVGSAVARNRLRRLYREAFRLIRPDLPPGIDLVLMPRGAGEPGLDRLKESLLKLARTLARKLAGGGSKS